MKKYVKLICLTRYGVVNEPFGQADIFVNPKMVSHIYQGTDEDTTIIVFADGSRVTVVGDSALTCDELEKQDFDEMYKLNQRAKYLELKKKAEKHE